MALLIGQPITGRELEQATSPWAPERFASMCDALTWAASGRQCPSQFSFTARVNATDGGIDAEWDVDLPDDGRSVPTPIVGPGWNVFQYKKRDLIAQDRRRIISNLKSSLAGAVRDLVQRFGQSPSRYILFVNVDLKHNDKSTLKKSILQGYGTEAKPQVEVLGAAELSALLNNYPYLKAAYFDQLTFKTWVRAHQEHLSRKFLGSGIDLVGREAELDRLKSWVDDSRVRVIVLSGPHDIGKSRLALEATRHRPHDVVQALDPRSMELRDYRDLCASHGEVIGIVEDPEPDAIESLVNETLGLSNFKLVITLPTLTSAPASLYGRDERVQSLHLEPLTEEEARRLLRATRQPLDFATEDWIVGHAGGIPGILLVAANFGSTLRRDVPTFIEQVGGEFERRIRAELGPDALKCAQLLSVMTHVGIAGNVESELRLICDLFGDGWTPHRARASFDDLVKAGLARCGGSFAEIIPPMLASYLVVQLLRGRFHEMLALFGRLDDPGRFIKRLSEVKSEEVERFWNAVFAADGLLKNFQAALDNVHLLRLIAGTVPSRTLRLLESGLRNSSREERLKIQGDQRRELIWAIEQLLFRIQTSCGAMRLLWLLADAENETYAGNTTAILAECFDPRHPRIPLSLQERIELLREFTSERVSTTGRGVAIQAVGDALSPKWLSLSHDTGPEPLDLRPILTYGDLYDYVRDLVDILISLAQQDDEPAGTALRILPKLTAELGLQTRPRDAIERFRTLVAWACTGKHDLNVSSLFRALHRVHENLSKSLEKSEFPAERQEEFQRYIAELDQLKTALEETDFATRFRRWTGGAPHRVEAELRKLAEEAVANPALLNADLLTWMLSSPSRRASVFFSFLGYADIGLVYLHRIEELGRQPDGMGAFVQYWSGWAQRDREAAEEHLDQLASAQVVSGNAIVMATGQLEANQPAVDRIENQIQAGRVEPEYAAGVLSAGRWMAGLGEEQFERLLKVIAGNDMKYVVAAVGMLYVWAMIRERPLRGGLAEFAWSCLEHEPHTVPSSEAAWNFDQLASKLTQDDPERGFRLLERCIQSGEADQNRWDPLDAEVEHQFWAVLHSTDSKRLFGLLLEAARTNTSRRYYLAWRLMELLDQEQDRDLLLSCARNDVESARVIASWLTSSKAGFWPIAFALLQKYPHDEELLSNLTAGLEQMGTDIEGPRSQFYKTLGQQIEQILLQPSTPPEVRPWLRDVLGRLEREIPRQIVWEYDLDVDDLHRHIRGKHSAQRLWAIGRVLKYAQWEDIRRLLTVEDIEEALPHVDLPEKRRRMLETLVKVWQHGS